MSDIREVEIDWLQVVIIRAFIAKDRRQGEISLTLEDLLRKVARSRDKVRFALGQLRRRKLVVVHDDGVTMSLATGVSAALGVADTHVLNGGEFGMAAGTRQRILRIPTST